MVYYAIGSNPFRNSAEDSGLRVVSLLEESHALELSRLLGVQPKTVQRIVDSFEDQGIIEGRVVGRERRLTFNR